MLYEMTLKKASDLHIQVNNEPKIRVDGNLINLEGYAPLSEEEVNHLFEPLLTEMLQKQFNEVQQVDFSHAVPEVARFRVNIYIQQGKQAGAFRRIPDKIPNLADLAAPAALLELARRPRGLVLVTGPTGSGKSTTLAALLDVINSERSEHILTIEDPIEFVHKPKRCLINQREVGKDVPSFALGLKASLRQDPDIILIGEMRDLDTTETAITAAETGHLVFGTLHTSSAPATIDRIVDQFPADRQEQIRVMLSTSLIGVVSQTLLPRVDGGRVAAHEVMVSTNPIQANIRKARTAQIRSDIQTGSAVGMQTMDRALVYLVASGLVREDIARGKSQKMQEFDDLLERYNTAGEINPPNLITPDMLAQTLPS